MDSIDICFVYRQESDYPPMGILSLIAYLKAKGASSRLIYYHSHRQVLRELEHCHPLMLGYSVTTGVENFYLELNKTLRERVDAVSVFGGPHPTFHPQFLERDGVDVIFRGEAEEALYEAISKYREHHALSALSEVKNVHLKLGSELVKNPVRRLVEDLDSLPPIDRSLMDSGRKAYVLTGRGCPFLCSYCHNHALIELYRHKGRYVRKNSVDRVMEELEEISRDGRADMARFIDDTFVIDRAWFDEFSERYKKQGGLPYTCNIRANLVDRAMIRSLAESGCVHVSLAAECGDDELRKTLLKRNVTNEQLISASTLLHEYGIPFSLLNILALPGTSFDDDLVTLELNQKCRPVIARAFLFQPYPGTALSDYAFSLGEVDPDVQFNRWGHSATVCNVPEKQERLILQTLFGVFVRLNSSPKFVRRVCSMGWLGGVYKVLGKLFYGYSLIMNTRLLKPTELLSWNFLKTVLSK